MISVVKISMFQFDQLDQNGLKIIETGEWRRLQHYTLEKSRVGSFMSGNLCAVFSIENDSVEMGRPQGGLQRHRGLEPISHRENLNKLQFFISKIERTKEKKMKDK